VLYPPAKDLWGGRHTGEVLLALCIVVQKLLLRPVMT
jgi:hypothetical protein